MSQSVNPGASGSSAGSNSQNLPAPNSPDLTINGVDQTVVRNFKSKEDVMSHLRGQTLSQRIRMLQVYHLTQNLVKESLASTLLKCPPPTQASLQPELVRPQAMTQLLSDMLEAHRQVSRLKTKKARARKDGRELSTEDEAIMESLRLELEIGVAAQGSGATGHENSGQDGGSVVPSSLGDNLVEQFNDLDVSGSAPGRVSSGQDAVNEDNGAGLDEH